MACVPTTLATLSQSQFEHVKKRMNKCVDHVVGEAPPTASLIPGTHRMLLGCGPFTHLPTHPLVFVADKNNTLTRVGKKNKKPWVKPRRLPFGALGFSFTGKGLPQEHTQL